MSNEMNEAQEVEVDESVVLSKFDGDAAPENEVERLTVNNGLVVEHVVIKDGEVVGPVGEGNLAGKDIGRLVT